MLWDLPAACLLTCLQQCVWPPAKTQTQTNHVTCWYLKMEIIYRKKQLDWAQVYLCTAGKTGENWRCRLGIYSKCYQISSLWLFIRTNFLSRVTITKMDQNGLRAIPRHPPITGVLRSFSSLPHIHLFFPPRFYSTRTWKHFYQKGISKIKSNVISTVMKFIHEGKKKSSTIQCLAGPESQS